MEAAVGLVGLGAMGTPMATVLATAGIRLAVHDVDTAKTSSFAREHPVRLAGSSRDVADGTEFVITILPNSETVESVLLGPNGVAEGLRPGSLVIEMSSGIPAVTRALADQLDARGIGLIDAPVSGGVARARAGELTIMVGGDDDAIDRALPILRVLGSQIHRTGPLGSGQAMKSLNNLVSAAGLAISVEALLVGATIGLDGDTVVAVLNSSSGRNDATQRKLGQFVLSQTFDSGFGLDLMVKDLRIALDLATAARLRVPLADSTYQLWSKGQIALGLGRDHTEIARYIRGEVSGGVEAS